MNKIKHTTFRFRADLKEDFKQATFEQGIDMTETLEEFMEAFVNAHKKSKQTS